jgi:hypothetical protein
MSVSDIASLIRKKKLMLDGQVKLQGSKSWVDALSVQEIMDAISSVEALEEFSEDKPKHENQEVLISSRENKENEVLTTEKNILIEWFKIYMVVFVFLLLSSLLGFLITVIQNDFLKIITIPFFLFAFIFQFYIAVKAKLSVWIWVILLIFSVTANGPLTNDVKEETTLTRIVLMHFFIDSFFISLYTGLKNVEWKNVNLKHEPEYEWLGKMECLSCGYEWKARRETPPAKCASCNNKLIKSVLEPKLSFWWF